MKNCSESKEELLHSPPVLNFENLYLNNPDLILIINSDCKIIKFNLSAENFFGSPKLENSKNLNLFFSPQIPSLFQNAMDNILKNEPFSNLTIPYKSKNEQIFLLDWRIFQLKSDIESANTRPFFCFYGRDVTNLVNQSRLTGKMEHELKQAALLQQELFTQPRAHPNFETATHYHPSQQTGGDWLVARLNEENNVIRLLIGDVTGHDFAASLMTGAIHSAYMATECSPQSSANA